MRELNEIETALRQYPRPYITDDELCVLFGGTPDSRYGRVKRLLAQGKLLHVRRGLYCLTSKLGYPGKPHPYELAQHIYGPSYISLESALSFHQLIPEAVYAITSVAIKRVKEFSTPLGLFSYARLPANGFYTGVTLLKANNYQYFMATPWKAICDYVYCYKKNWKTMDAMIQDLRMNKDVLPVLFSEEKMQLINYYQSTRINRFLNKMQEDVTR